ncbi:MAG TPA: hypothetical protein VFS05_16375 [Gemmatimonadaceae bacterium]|nr:hypothetical protein [Gemmatimonadaceae bacterium]
MSEQGQSQAMAVGDFLPYLTLPAPGGAAPVALRRLGREATVLVRVHAAACEECRRYLAELAAAAPDFRAWDGRVVAVAPEPEDGEALRGAVPGAVIIASDAEEAAPLAGGAGVVIADRFGQVYHMYDAGEGHGWPAPRELEEWLRFLATQCPE